MAPTIGRALLGLGLLATASTALTAQTGPFADGELLVRISDLGPDTLYRIDPTTGTAAALVTDLVSGYSEAGWLAFDTYRGGVLAFTAYQPFGISSPRLLLIREDGGLTDLLGDTGDRIQSIAPVGDGRVYFRKGGVLHLFDANGALAPVLDFQGQTITLDLQHMVYDAPTNSLIGVAAATSTTLPCDGPGVLSVHRLPLATGGGALSGPILCNSIATSSSSPIGLDHLPSGSLLLTFADRAQFQVNPLIQIAPATLVGTSWAATDLSDLNGAVWCDPIGAAVLWDDQNNELRTFTAGGTGTGSLLPTSIQVGGGNTGTSPANQMSDVDFQGLPCAGFVRTLGTGTAGIAGRIPRIGVGNCPGLGNVLPITIANGRASALAFLVFSARSTSLPLFGGTLYVRPPFVETRAFTLTGAGGFGRVDFQVPNDASVVGVSFFGQAAVRDSAVPQGWALTQAVEIQVQ